MTIPVRNPRFQRQRRPLLLALGVLVLSQFASSGGRSVRLFAQFFESGSFAFTTHKKLPRTVLDTTNRSFAACLLWKDDNHHLIEWLAYHYTILPLRRLILAKDPRAKTSPSHILDRYRRRNLINITEWNDEDYFGKDQLEHWKNWTNGGIDEKSEPRTFVELHRERQASFLRKYILDLNAEAKWTWTLFVDVDEFLTLNIPSVSKRTIFPDLEELLLEFTNENGGNNPSKTTFDMLEIARAANISELYTNHTCIPVGRLSFGSRETGTIDPSVAASIPNGFNASDFLTFRWSWRFREGEKKNGLHKSIIDLSRVDTTKLRSYHDSSPHRPIKHYCVNPWWNRRALLHSANHYMGTREQWSFRSDPRSSLDWTRTPAIFRERIQKSTVRDYSANGTWLVDFVESVGGLEEAQQLLAGVGQVEHPSHRIPV